MQFFLELKYTITNEISNKIQLLRVFVLKIINLKIKVKI